MSFSNGSLGLDVRDHRVHLNAAHAWAVNDCDVDVTVDTPLATPRVSHNVEGSTSGVGAIANNDDCVIEFEAASSAIEDATTVELEGNSVSLD